MGDKDKLDILLIRAEYNSVRAQLGLKSYGNQVAENNHFLAKLAKQQGRSRQEIESLQRHTRNELALDELARRVVITKNPRNN